MKKRRKKAVDQDDLINDLIAHNPKFQALLARSLASPRQPFKPATVGKGRRGNRK